jgi:hypothetical protein
MARSTPEAVTIKSCIQHCTECHGACLETVRHCLKACGEPIEPTHVRLLLDCAQICQTGADYMLRGSDLHPLTCDVCAEVCELCAAECMKHAACDEQMRVCAQACQRCAESCEQIADG